MPRFVNNENKDAYYVYQTVNRIQYILQIQNVKQFSQT